MTRLKCKKCGSVFEHGFGAAFLSVHLGPYHNLKCPACGKSSWFNVYSSAKEPVTYPPQENQINEPELAPSEEELERKRIEESKYERT